MNQTISNRLIHEWYYVLPEDSDSHPASATPMGDTNGSRYSSLSQSIYFDIVESIGNLRNSFFLPVVGFLSIIDFFTGFQRRRSGPDRIGHGPPPCLLANTSILQYLRSLEFPSIRIDREMSECRIIESRHTLFNIGFFAYTFKQRFPMMRFMPYTKAVCESKSEMP